MSRPLAAITGASSGIGAEFARQLAARGYDLLLIARREENLRIMSGELTVTYGVSTVILPVDLAVEDGRNRAAAHIAAAENLALLVNNAGFGTQGAFTAADLESQNRMHRLHILATLDLTHAALRNFKSKKGTAEPLVDRAVCPPFSKHGIISVSSVAAFEQAPYNVSYCATKAWINSFMTGLSMELAAEKSPIIVQALCPGFTYSEFHDVLGMDRRAIPSTFWLPARFVVAESLRGFDRGDLIVIPSWKYRVMVAAIRLVPSSWMRGISIYYSRKRRERAQTFKKS